MYDTEKDVPENGTIAVQWYSLAAQQGHLYAQSRLGYMHENSKGAPKNYVIAYVWQSVAKTLGMNSAASKLAILKLKMRASDMSEVKHPATVWPEQAH